MAQACGTPRGARSHGPERIKLDDQGMSDDYAFLFTYDKALAKKFKLEKDVDEEC
jgi:hypothetical protein